MIMQSDESESGSGNRGFANGAKKPSEDAFLTVLTEPIYREWFG
jgi:hypothetical protein